jgi:putative membrane protein
MPAKTRLSAADLAASVEDGGRGPLEALPGRIPLRTAALFLLGLLAVAGLVYHVGVSDIAALLASLGWRAPLIVVPYACISVFDALGLGRALGRRARRRISLWRLYWIRHAGEALSNVTPTAGLGGEPLKAYLLRRHGVAGGDGVASVVIAKTAVICSQFLFTILGLLLLLGWLGVLRDRAPLLIAGGVLALLACAILIAGQRRGLAAASVHWLGRLRVDAPFVQRLERQAQAIDHALLRFYRDDRRGFAVATSYHMLGWLLGAAEVMLFFSLMGVSCEWRQAIIIESLTQATMAAAVIVPGGLGVQEISGTVLCRILGLGEVSGAALMLLKRAREVVFTSIGLALISWLSRGR